MKRPLHPINWPILVALLIVLALSLLPIGADDAARYLLEVY